MKNLLSRPCVEGTSSPPRLLRSTTLSPELFPPPLGRFPHFSSSPRRVAGTGFFRLFTKWFFSRPRLSLQVTWFPTSPFYGFGEPLNNCLGDRKVRAWLPSQGILPSSHIHNFRLNAQEGASLGTPPPEVGFSSSRRSNHSPPILSPSVLCL